MRPVVGVIQHYPWGDPEFLPSLLGVAPDGRPWAELWLGTHPNGPSSFDDGTPLLDTTGELPYLLKVLAAAEPLSLQTHPDAERARLGFARGVYPDDRPKPELLCALTRFEAFCGVRPVAATTALLDELGLDDIGRLLTSDGPIGALTAIYRGAIDPDDVVASCTGSRRPEADWVCRLAVRYPHEPSVAATLLLNHVVLEPGEALRLDAGNLHAYLHGAGVELMGNSDNVVRGGLTTKHVDVDELLAVLDPTPIEHPVLAVDTVYELPAAGVALHRLAVGADRVAIGHELGVDLDGRSWYLAPGESMVASADSYVVAPLDR